VSDIKISPIYRAAKNFADTFADSMLANDIAERLSCSELEALCGLLDGAGQTCAADYWREVHADTDEEGDEHYV
jgi:hypothetical protein